MVIVAKRPPCDLHPATHFRVVRIYPLREIFVSRSKTLLVILSAAMNPDGDGGDYSFNIPWIPHCAARRSE
jgi:hypothetical protein